MANYQYMMSADDVAKELDCSKSYAYKLVKAMNKELAGAGIYHNGRTDSKSILGKKDVRIRAGCELREEKKGMAYKEKDTKKWTAQWFETNAKGEKKKRRKRGFSTKKEALEYERQKKLNSSRSMDMKLSEFMEVYFEDKQNELKERTMKNKRYMMEQHIIPVFWKQMMSEIQLRRLFSGRMKCRQKAFRNHICE